MSNVKLIIFLFPLFFCSCIGNKKMLSVTKPINFNNVKMDLQIINEEISGRKKKSLIFIFYNNFSTLDSTLYISFPCYANNVNLKLFKDGKIQDIQRLIRISGECGKKRIEVKPNSSTNAKLAYDIDDIFRIDDNAKYVLQVSYSGIIYLQGEKILKDNQSMIIRTIEW